ncbi:MAG: aspartate aminotransferase family protein [Candidatus Dadabacteria bacterium]|nr:MAG: aspartate aminotransferase family protein [Candidatus Dadabacteria bacterium]
MKAEVLATYAEYCNPMKVRTLRHAGLEVIEARREGACVWDVSGKCYIDCITSAGSMNVGRRNPEVVEALKRALDEYDIGVFIIASKPKADLAKKLAEVTPGDLKMTMFAVGGGEANDFAIKLARGYTRRTEIITTEKCYHGHTGLALAGIGREAFRKPFEPLAPGFRQVPFNDLDAMAAAISERTAAVMVEPIQGEGGIHVATDEYLQGLRRLCDERGALLIFDEVQTGWCRTGKMFACEYSGVVPDIMTVAKSLGGGLYPIAATVFKEPLGEFLIANPFIHLSTFGGADLGCIVALKTIEIMQRERLWEKALARGAQFQVGFEELRQRHGEILAEYRGRGLMMGLQFTDDSHGPRMTYQLAKRGVMALYSGNEPSVMRLMPSLVISEAQVATVLEALDASMQAIKDEDAGRAVPVPETPGRRRRRRPGRS